MSFLHSREGFSGFFHTPWESSPFCLFLVFSKTGVISHEADLALAVIQERWPPTVRGHAEFGYPASSRTFARLHKMFAGLLVGAHLCLFAYFHGTDRMWRSSLCSCMLSDFSHHR
jgi:hypothetical protein